MANDLGKLWFEMGVRDNVTGAMQNAIKEAQRLGISIDAVTKNTDILTKAFYKIEEVSSRASGAIKKSMELGIDSSKLQQGLQRLQNFEKKLLSLQKNGKLASEKNVLKDYLDANYDEMLRSMSRVTRQQERLNSVEEQGASKRSVMLSRNLDFLKEILFNIQSITNQANKIKSEGLRLGLNTSNIDAGLAKFREIQNFLTSLNRKDLSTGGLKELLGADYNIALKQMQQILATQKQLNKEANNNRLNRSGIEKKNADFLKRATYTIDSIRNRANSAIISSNVLGVDTEKLKSLIQELEKFQNERLKVSENVDLKKSVGTDYDILIKKIKQATSEQEKLNNAINRQNRSNEISSRLTAIKQTREQLELQDRLISNYNKIDNSMNRMGRTASQLRNIMRDYLSVYTGANLLRSVITTGGQFETQRIALQTLLGDLREGLNIYSQMQSLAIQSPMSFMDLASYTKQLAAFNIPYNELYDTTKRLADISAGLGVDMSRIILAYGQVRSATVLRGQELRQFTEAGIPMVDALAKKFTELNGKIVTSADVLNKLIPTKQVPFEMVKEVLEDMTNEGGRFYNMQLVLADTLAGKWSNLRDAWEIMLSRIADGNTLTGKFFKASVSGATELIKSLDTLLPLVSGLVFGFGGKKVTNALLPKIKTFGTSDVVNNYMKSKELEAERITRKQMTMEISDAERNILMTRKQMTAEDYKLLATSGKLNTYQLAYLYKQKQINAELVKQLVQSNAITAQEAKKILASRNYLGVLRMTLSTMKEMALSVIKDPFTWITLGISAFMELQNEIGKTEAMMDNIVSSSSQRYQQLAEVIKTMREQGSPTSQDDYNQRNTTMLDSLKEVSWDYDEIERQSQSIDDLSKRYQYLNSVLQQTQAAYKWMSENAGTIGGLLDNTGGLKTSQGFWGALGSIFSFDWINDDLAENMDDWDEMFKSLQSSAIEIKKYTPQIQDAISKLISDFPKLSKSLDGKSMEEQLKIIADSGYWPKLMSRINDVSLSTNYALKDWNNTYNKFKSSGEDVTEDAQSMANDIKDIIDNMAKSRGQTTEQFVKENETLVATMVDNIVRSFEKGSEQIQNRVIDIIRQFIGLSKEYDNLGNKLKIKPLTPYQQQTNLGKQMLHNVIARYGNGIMTVAEVNKIAGTGKNPYDEATALDNLKKTIQELRNTYEARKALYKENNKKTRAARYDLERYTKFALANGLTVDDLNKKPKYGFTKQKRQGSQEDVWLKDMNARLNLLSKYFSLYEKYRDTLGEAGAKSKIGSDVRFESLREIGITDPTDRVAAFKKIYKIYKDNSTTADRRKKTEEVLAQLYDEQADALVRQNKILNETATRQLKMLNSQWDTYKKWIEATGNQGISSMIAFGRNTSYQDISQQLRDELSKNGSIIKAGGLNEVLNMSDTRLDEIFGKAGQDADGLREKIDLLKESSKSWNEELIDGLLDIIKENKSYDTQLSDIETKLKRQIELINSQTYSSNADENNRIRQRYINEATDEANKQKAEISFKKFQDESDWVTIFDDLDRVSTETISSMIDKIDGFTKQSGLSVEVVKKLRDALTKLRDEELSRNPFGGLAGSLSRADAIRSFLNGGLGNVLQSGNKYILDENQAKRMGLTAGGEGYTYNELMSALKSAEHDFTASISNLKNTFDDLQGVLNPLINMFTALGTDMEPFTDTLNIIGNALGTASSSGQSFSNLMGLSVGKDKTLGSLLGIKNAGLWGAVAGAGLSIMTSIFQMHDKALQKEIEASQQRQKEMQNLTTNVQKVLERLMGGVYNYRASDADLNDLLKYFDKDIFGRDKYEYITEDTRNQIKEAEDSRSYYDTYLASLMAQRDELAHQMDAEGDKKNSDSGKIEDMKQQLSELDDQIKYVANDLAKELYGIDFKSWASELSDALVNAWASGTDAAEAFKDKVTDIMKQVGMSILTQKYIEPMLEQYMQKFMDYFTKNNGILDENGLAILAQMYDAADSAAEITDSFMQGLEIIANQHGETIKDTSAASGADVIGGITEDEAGLLLAYVNAMRADLSSELMYSKQVAEELFPQVINILAVHQAQLISIAENTRRSADAAERLSSTIDSVVSGTKKLSVITYVKK